VTKQKSDVSFTNNADGQPVQIHLAENFFNTKADIRLPNGHVIATIDRGFWSVNKYNVTIAPGMDMALCVAMCICVDERNQNNSAGNY
jgi:uncharacterized protein YxjI